MSTPTNNESGVRVSGGAILAFAVMLAVVVGGLAIAGQWTYLMVAIVIGIPAIFMLLTVRNRESDEG